MVTAREEGWKPLSLTTDNSKAIADLFKDRAGQFGIDPIRNVPSSGTSAVEVTLVSLLAPIIETWIPRIPSIF